MNRLRVVIVEDHQMMRVGVRLLLEQQVDICVVGESGNGAEALEMIRTQRPDVVLLDLSLPDMDGLDLLQMLKEVSPATRIVIFSGRQPDRSLRVAMQRGASGYLNKGGSAQELLAAVRNVGSRRYLGSAHEQQLLEGLLQDRSRRAESAGGYEMLSSREQQIFHLLIAGHSSTNIGSLLCISPKTVRKHRSSICQKTGLDSSVQMLRFAIRHGLIDPETWIT